MTGENLLAMPSLEKLAGTHHTPWPRSIVLGMRVMSKTAPTTLRLAVAPQTATCHGRSLVLFVTEAPTSKGKWNYEGETRATWEMSGL